MNAIHDPFNFKFPPEIASLIFSLSMGDEDYEPDRSKLRKLPTQFLLGSVSRRWRQVARSTPQLWSTISFTLVKEKTNTLPPLRFINDWLQLSGSLPLNLWIIEDAASNFYWETSSSRRRPQSTFRALAQSSLSSGQTIFEPFPWHHFPQQPLRP